MLSSKNIHGFPSQPWLISGGNTTHGIRVHPAKLFITYNLLECEDVRPSKFPDTHTRNAELWVYERATGWGFQICIGCSAMRKGWWVETCWDDTMFWIGLKKAPTRQPCKKASQISWWPKKIATHTKTFIYSSACQILHRPNPGFNFTNLMVFITLLCSQWAFRGDIAFSWWFQMHGCRLNHINLLYFERSPPWHFKTKIWTYILTCYLKFYLTPILTFYSAFYLTFFLAA